MKLTNTANAQNLHVPICTSKLALTAHRAVTPTLPLCTTSLYSHITELTGIANGQLADIDINKYMCVL
jgi:hypothetical protein